MLKGFSWTVPLKSFAEFNKGLVVSGIVSGQWRLSPGDRLPYECGQTIMGVAEVVSVKPVGVPAVDWGAMESVDSCLVEAPGLECQFRKVE